MITLENYLTANGRYKNRLNHKELDESKLDNARTLLSKVNKLLSDLNITHVDISSGFRPSGANSATANAATHSAHMTCEAIDIIDDKNQTLCKRLDALTLQKYDLYREDSAHTVGKSTNWCHLQIRPTKSGNRIFKP